MSFEYKFCAFPMITHTQSNNKVGPPGAQRGTEINALAISRRDNKALGEVHVHRI